jgi:hypothetical protein
VNVPRLVPLFLCGFGLLALAVAYFQWRRGETSRGWTRTTGRIVVSQVEELPGPVEQGYPQYRPRIRYRFSVGSHDYEGRETAVGSTNASSDAAAVRREAERFPAGSEVTVFYDPADPRRAVLEPGAPRLAPLFLFGLALLAGGLYLLSR